MLSRRTFIALPAGVAGVLALQQTPAQAAVSWPRDQVLPTFPRPRRLDVADVHDLHGDDQALLATLQGVVNRREPRLYFIFGDDPSDPAWLDTLGLPTRRYDDPMSLLAKYRKEIRGAIVYDPDVPDTINIATTLAGLENAVIASPDQAVAHKLPIVRDLRGQFTDDRVATYRWQVEHLFPRCTQRILTGIPPTRSAAVPGVEWREVARETEEVRDGSNHDTYELDLTAELGGEGVYLRFQDAFGNDGWGSSVKHVTVLADGQQIADFDANSAGETPFMFDADGSAIAPEGHRFVDGGSYWIYRFEPPAGTTSLVARVEMWNQYLVTATDQAPTRVEAFPYFRDYIVGTKAMVFWLAPDGAEGEVMTEIFGTVAPTTAYLGWFSGAVAGEHGGVGRASEQGLEVLAADFYMNGTVFSGAPARISTKPPNRTLPALRNKVYLTFTVGEGDNIQYCQHRMRAIWDNADRGAVPLNWTISPLLRDIGPVIYSYYQRTATPNDLLIAGPSGAGYTYPGLWPADQLDRFTAMTGRYMRATGLNVIFTINDDGNRETPLTEPVGASYRENTPALGMVVGWERGNNISKPGGLPVVADFARFADVEDYHDGLYQHVADWDASAPRFVACGVQAWNWSPTEVAALVRSLDDRFVVLRGDVFFDLLGRTI